VTIDIWGGVLKFDHIAKRLSEETVNTNPDPPVGKNIPK
jgi:hypothetical protein